MGSVFLAKFAYLSSSLYFFRASCYSNNLYQIRFCRLFFFFFLTRFSLFFSSVCFCQEVGEERERASMLGEGRGGGEEKAAGPLPLGVPGLAAAPTQRLSPRFFFFLFFFPVPSQHLTRVSARGFPKMSPSSSFFSSSSLGCGRKVWGRSRRGFGSSGPPLGGRGSRRKAGAFLPKASRRDGLEKRRADRCGYRHGILHALFGSRFFSVALVIYSLLVYIAI